MRMISLNAVPSLFFLSIFFGIGSPFPAASGQEDQTPWPDRLFVGKIMEHDFGTVAHGTKVVYRFLMENPYVPDVHIANVYSSCGCTTPIIEKETLQTHEKGSILAQFNADVNQFSKSATITVVFDKPYPATATLTIKGYIRPDITFTPESVNYGLIAEGKESVRHINFVYSGKDSAWRLVEAKSPVEFLTAKVIENKPVASGQIHAKVEIKVNPDLPGVPKGRFSERVTLITNEGGLRQGTIPVLVEGTVPGGISVNPPAVFLGFLKPGATAKKEVWIRSDKKFTVTAIKCDEPAIKIAFDAEAKPAFRHHLPIGIQVPDDAGGKKYLVNVEVETSEPGLKAAFPVQAEIGQPDTGKGE
ncbi:MAG TPA: hypothetical protein DEB39_14460 [Planctomycetaceae bacterium]|nr:hypothetical protein [Planctomycetaceae bacterium]